MKKPGITAKNDNPQTYDELFLQINPDKETIKNLETVDDPGPMIMLNYLRFRPRGDMSIYSLYGKDAAPCVMATGSMIFFYGKALTDLDPSFGFDTSWDGIVMPIYKRRASFLELQKNPQYQRAIPYRTAGTFARLLYVIGDSETLAEETLSIGKRFDKKLAVDVVEGEVYVAELVKFKADGGRELFKQYLADRESLLDAAGGNTVLSRAAETPIVSQDEWDHLTLTRFPSKEILINTYKSQEWKELEAGKQAAIENNSSLAANGIPLPK